MLVKIKKKYTEATSNVVIFLRQDSPERLLPQLQQSRDPEQFKIVISKRFYK
jgi:hypothetical protein